ncbi:hypothetical protein CYY_000512 [Polysphondylium violaceum]|uniref:PBZ-type domain-containing protein n=1 Tax=Polysphondylium violaceum TaxID=133409 RepID=A0A8J4Q4M5_9MYCE|nr:hypothetical protein CYY_000512 [Polysphondylium violaceum]
MSSEPKDILRVVGVNHDGTFKDYENVYDQFGSSFIGRGDFDIQEKKCSRKQISIIRNNDNSNFIACNGVNPSYLKKHDQEFFVQMVRDQNYPIENGDCFSMIYESFTFQIIIESKKNKQQQSNSNNSDNENNTTTDKKRKAIDSDEKVEEKKKKKDELPVCPHGASCYRKNPTHFQEYSHPWNEKKSVSDDDQETKNPKDLKPDLNKTSTTTTPKTITDNVPIKQPDLQIQQKKPQPQPQPPQPNNDQQPQPQIKKDIPKKLTLQDIKKDEPKKTIPTTTTSSKNDITIPNPIPTPNPLVAASNNDKAQQQSEEISNAGKIVGPKYKKKKLSDVHKPRTLVFPFLSSIKCGIDIDKAAEIASQAIQEYLQFHQNEEDIKLKMVIEKTIYSDALESFKKILGNKWDKRFEILSIENLNSIEQFSNNCRIYATESTWRLKKIPSNKFLYEDMLSIDGKAINFEKDTKNRFPNPAKIGKSYPVAVNVETRLHKEYGVEYVVLILPPNMNPLKPDCLASYTQSLPLLKESYHSLFTVLDNF